MITEERYYHDFDEDTGDWCVFDSDENPHKAVSSWSDEGIAKDDAKKKNEEYSTASFSRFVDLENEDSIIDYDSILQSIDLLRYVVQLFGSCREGFNQRFTTIQLLLLAKACRDSEWDFWPDGWTERQISDAIMYGRIPTWKESGSGNIYPTYDDSLKDIITGTIFTTTSKINVE